MTFTYCPRCATELEMRPSAGPDPDRATCPNCGFVHYENPTPTVQAWIDRDGSYLALRRDEEPLKGEWNMPGGFVEVGEPGDEAIAREVREETGLVVQDFHGLAYRVEVSAPGLGWMMRVEAWEVEVDGEIVIADPDGIVEHVRRMDRDEAATHIAGGPPWIHVPIGEWLDGICGAAIAETVGYRFRVDGADRASSTAVRLP